MAKKFFLRNDPETIKNAANMTEDQFVEHYSDTMSTSDALRKAYKEMNKKVGNNKPAVRDQKIKNDDPISAQVQKDNDLEKKNPGIDIERVGLTDDGDRMISGTITGTQSKISTLEEAGVGKSLKAKLAEAAGEEEPTGKKGKKEKPAKPKKEKDPNAPKKEGGFVKTAEGEKRDNRIKELLAQNMPVPKILDTLAAEGIKAFGPQVYKIKKELKGE